MPRSDRDVQLLLGFMNIFQRSIQQYSKVTLPLLQLLQRSQTSSWHTADGTAKCEWTWEAKLMFQKLNRSCTDPLIIQHCDLAKPFILHEDSCWFPIADILNQYSHSEFSSRSISTPGHSLQLNPIHLWWNTIGHCGHNKTAVAFPRSCH